MQTSYLPNPRFLKARCWALRLGLVALVTSACGCSSASSDASPDPEEQQVIFETSAGEIVLDHEVKVNTDEKLAAENRRKKVQRERAREVREIEDAERQILHDQLLQEYKPN